MKLTFWLLTAFAVACMAVLSRLDAGLRSEYAPWGVVSFEFCGFFGTCGDVLREWGDAGKGVATLSLKIDYLLILGYTGALVVGLIWLSTDLRATIRRRIIGVSVPAALLAGVADGVENYVLMETIQDGMAPAVEWLASALASVKFLLVLVALLVLLFLCARRVVVAGAVR